MLPVGTLPAVAERTRATVFGEVADLYDRARPAYPQALVDDVLGAAPASPPRILEVGSGTGKATVLFAPSAAAVVCVEIDEAMANVARHNCAAFPNVEILVCRFEDWDTEPDAFDLVVSGQAWHWVDLEVAAPKVREALRPGGAFAAFWNWPVPERNPLHDELIELYERDAPGIATSSIMLRGRAGIDPELQSVEERLLGEPVTHVYSWLKTYTGREYVDLLRTHSDHRMLAPDHLDRLTGAIEALIDRSGGTVEIEYETTLRLVNV